jgi:hypothetical protein
MAQPKDHKPGLRAGPAQGSTSIKLSKPAKIKSKASKSTVNHQHQHQHQQQQPLRPSPTLNTNSGPATFEKSEHLNLDPALTPVSGPTAAIQVSRTKPFLPSKFRTVQCPTLLRMIPP